VKAAGLPSTLAMKKHRFFKIILTKSGENRLPRVHFTSLLYWNPFYKHNDSPCTISSERLAQVSEHSLKLQGRQVFGKIS
jgi:hypothetical protein